ncbi:MAG: hypothetical protein C0605_00840 [Hyphomicrobiales bacterium]|nr:MAG: hypothetical protein C0605_00840 [Hyphomicrobiales bacterium]
MGLSKLIKNLQELLNTKESRQLKRIQTLEDLLRQLKDKEQKFAARLEVADDAHDIKRLKRRLKVCRAQLKKGQQALFELQNLDDPSV